MSMIAEEILNRPISVLSGPSHAEEVSRAIPCAVVIASKNDFESKKLQAYFMNDFFRVYTSTDCLGAELGGALKILLQLPRVLVMDWVMVITLNLQS